MISGKQISEWREMEMVKTTCPSVDELKEAEAWDIVGELIEEIDELKKRQEGFMESFDTVLRPLRRMKGYPEGGSFVSISEWIKSRLTSDAP